MGGGHISRPDYGRMEVDAANPMTEFYSLLQNAVDAAGWFQMPGAYVAFRPPLDHMLYEEDIRGCCTFANHAKEGFLEIFAPARFRVLYSDLLVDAHGAPTALLLTQESSRKTMAVTLMPPFFCPEEPLARAPQCASSLTLRLTPDDVTAMDEAPAALGQRLLEDVSAKQWTENPRMDDWMRTALAAAQRRFRQNRQVQSREDLWNR